MSKRGASDYITKEHGSISQDSEVKPSMASATQMATRKTATPRGRLNRAGTPQRRFPPSANNTEQNPFASLAPQQPQQTFGSVGNGVIFGGAAQDNNNAAPQNSGFTFSTNNAPANNPFATNLFAPVNGTPNFGGQKSENNQDDSMDTGSPQKKRSKPEGNMFGGGFGQTTSTATPTPPTFGFGQTQAAPQSQTNASFGSLFGAQTSAAQSQTPAPASNPFSSLSSGINQQSSAPTFSFGQSASKPPPSPAQQPAKSGFVFGQTPTTSAPSQQAAPTQPIYGFGQPPQTATEQQTPKPAFTFGSTAQSSTSQTPTPAFSFSAAQKSSSEQQTPKPTTSLFGGQAPVSQAAQNSPLIFGAQSSAPQPPQIQTSTTASTSLFGNSTQSTVAGQASAPTTFSFGKPAETPQKQQPATSAATGFQFGQTSAAPSASEQPKNAFGGFNFNQSQSTPSADVGEKPSISASTETPQSTSSLFGSPRPDSPQVESSSASGFSTPKPSSQPMFGSQSEQPKKTSALFGQTPSSKPISDVAPATTGKPSFSFGQPASSPTNEPSSADDAPKLNAFASLFPPAASTAASPSKPAPAPLFGAPKSSAPTPPSGMFGAAPPSSGGLFTPSPAKTAAPADQHSTEETGEVSSSNTPKKPLFGTLTKSAPAGLADQAAAPQPRPSAQASSEPKELFSAAKTVSPSAAAPDVNVPTQRAVYTKSPSRMPKTLNAEGFMEYDKNYRLRALNKEFQKQVATLDADRVDFENLVRHYVAARSAIGGDMGLYQRTTAGSKRKSGEVEDEAIPPQYKKARIDESNASRAEPSKRGFTESTSATAPVAPRSATSADASSLFNKMIPSASQLNTKPNTTEPAKKDSVFSNVQFIPAPANGGAFNPTSSFTGNTMNAGSTPAAKRTTNFGQLPGSTTPMKSPPKNNLFGMPSNESKDTNKRKAGSDVEVDDVSSEDDSRKKRSKSSTATPNNIFGASKSSALTKVGSPTKKSNGPFISDDEDETDDQTGDDAQDGDFAPNADGSDDDDNDSADDDSQQVSDEEVNQTAPEDSETSAPEEDHADEIKNNPNAGRSLFDRVESPATKPESNTGATSSPFGGSGIDWKAASGVTPDAPAFSPSTPASKSPYKPATTFNFTPTPATKPAPTAGASVLAGGLTNGQEFKFDGLFGSQPASRSSTPDPDGAGGHAAGPTSTPGDQTWKKGQDIKFNLTEASPDKLGSSSFGTNSLGFSFGSSTANPAPGFLSATPHLGLESGLSSGISSRATSPGATDNESVATSDEEGGQTDVQQDLMTANPGEENDDVLFTVKAKALVMAKGERAKQLKIQEHVWTSIGVGALRLLKSRETGRVRVLLRSDPGANIIINNYLEPTTNYDFKPQGANQKGGAVFGGFVRDGYLDSMVLKVKDAESAKALAALMMKHRSD